MTEIEDRWRDLGEFIREQRRVGQLSLRKLSELSGISNPYLSQIERGLRKPSAEILRNIAGALSISAETLYVRAGILDERAGEYDLVGDIRRDPYIDEEQKKTLVHIYLSFRDAHGASVPTVGGGDGAGDGADVSEVGDGVGDGADVSELGEAPADPLAAPGSLGPDDDDGLAEMAADAGPDPDDGHGTDDPLDAGALAST